MRLIEEILYRKTQSLPIQILLPSRKAEFLQLVESQCAQMLLQIRDILEDSQISGKRISGICLPMRIFRSKSGSLIFGAMLKDYQK